MFIKRTTRRVGDKAYVNHLLVESVATPHGPRHRTICSLGSLAPAPKEEWQGLAHKLAAALGGQTVDRNGDSYMDASEDWNANGVLDPGEAAVVDFTLRNIGSASTSNLVAMLQNGGGVSNSSGAQTYGVMASGGGTGTQPFSFRVDPNLDLRSNSQGDLRYLRRCDEPGDGLLHLTNWRVGYPVG